VTFAGAEKVISELVSIYPDCDIFCVIDFLKDDDRKKINSKKTTSSFIQKLPFARKKYQNYLPIMPIAIEQIDVSKYDLIISSSHAVAKGILIGPDQLHISYVHSPIRYAWDLQHEYLNNNNVGKGLKSFLMRYLLHKLRIWDYRTANGVDHFIGNSKFIGRRIKKVYGRNSDIIYPPVDINNFSLVTEKLDYYVTASRLVPYKKIDIIVEAFTKMPEKKLIVIGSGTDLEKMRKLATPNIEVLGYQPDDILIEHMQRAKAFIFAAEEDFGITPVEALACGTPVIAFGKGGVTESVVPLGCNNPTGLFFDQQTAESIVSAIKLFEANIESFNPLDCRKRSELFSIEVFKQNMFDYIEGKWSEFLLSKEEFSKVTDSEN